MARHQPYFVTLGLDEPPKDRKAVKLAYSRQLKKTRPEDDPEGFMRLRDAHDVALNILARQAEKAAWEAKQSPPSSVSEIDGNSPSEEPTPDAALAPSLTYGDMLPDAETASATSYAIGRTPALDAPALPNVLGADFGRSSDPQTPPLQQDIIDLFSHTRYNDRENWNHLFRKARQLDIDDYVDFEYSLMDMVLKFHGYYDPDTPHFDQPEKLPQKLSPSIAASLFKTMSWDQVSGLTYQKAAQIDWLNRRMHMSRMGTVPLNDMPASPIQGPSILARWFWPALGGLIALALLADLLTT
ncbi:hypothetical protein GCM10011309_02680 [Litorimonas cladophorae]|uniref:J domain-containing protein n=1 Tax=Litorimonas cladophorae TaxID=1220491 RepID=A0A918KBR4_9PROT|nr:hypothetical protein [Litorimonas cladophorae]GGX57208.1 hypothetical protein GCM10011309_02680 [Litorimonas cladophorae]